MGFFGAWTFLIIGFLTAVPRCHPAPVSPLPNEVPILEIDDTKKEPSAQTDGKTLNDSKSETKAGTETAVSKAEISPNEGKEVVPVISKTGQTADDDKASSEVKETIAGDKGSAGETVPVESDTGNNESTGGDEKSKTDEKDSTEDNTPIGDGKESMEGKVEPIGDTNSAASGKESAGNSKESAENSKDQSAESGKELAEDSKESAEDSKESVEDSKESAEDSKESAESGKESAESGKESAEDSKESIESGKESAVDKKEPNEGDEELVESDEVSTEGDKQSTGGEKESADDVNESKNDKLGDKETSDTSIGNSKEIGDKESNTSEMSVHPATSELAFPFFKVFMVFSGMYLICYLLYFYRAKLKQCRSGGDVRYVPLRTMQEKAAQD